jgi:hypothetical protein
MSKQKIAISIDKNLLELIDKKVDGKVLQSRSQAIEFFLRKGLSEALVSKAILMLTAEQHKLVLENNAIFLKKQLAFLKRGNIQKLIWTTQPSPLTKEIKKICDLEGFETKIYEGNTHNNSEALLLVRNEFTEDCLVISGDVLNDFNVQDMIKKHFQLGKLVTMGMMSKAQTKTEGSAVVDGDYVVQFHEKSEHFITNIINAGIYVMKSEALSLLEGKQNIEHELFPKLAKLKQLIGHFIYGKYEHLGRPPHEHSGSAFINNLF